LLSKISLPDKSLPVNTNQNSIEAVTAQPIGFTTTYTTH